MRIEVNRIVTQSFQWSPSRIDRFEAELSENGIISLATLRARFSKEYKAMIKRGEIGDLVEYYMAKEPVSNTRNAATKREREKLEEMMAVFEETEVAKFRDGRPSTS